MVYIKSEKIDTIIIPEKSLRFRVIANSNSLSDYKTKTNIKNILEKELAMILSKAQTLEETKQIITNNLDNIDLLVKENLVTTNQDYEINFGNNYFPKKNYKKVVYPEGKYESLVITLGEGKGENWWCVLFPPLCLLENSEETTDVEYQFFVSRIIDYFN
ncbi:MAG: stage II sporulation protein R [Bacilli bacterium]|nr:stage II sporulation protein R [Bacilli bacterium]